MILDAPSFELVLTPEAALSIVQKELQRRRWPRFEVEDVRLVYVPYYVFSFDVASEGSAPGGKAAVNASSGEVDEFIPQLLERPLKKTKQTDAKSPKAEVEPTNISLAQIEAVAAAKVSSAVGVKKENISVSAIAKYYIPFFRVWVTVPAETGDNYKINVDALMGAPLGIDAIPGHEKGWEEAGEETFDKMKSPGGWVELINESIHALSAGGPASFLQTPVGKWAALLLVIVVLAFLVFRAPSVGAECTPAEGMLGPREYFGLAGAQYLQPRRTPKGEFFVQGTCVFTNNEKEPLTSCVRAALKENGNPTSYINTTCAVNVPAGSSTEKEFQLTWSGSSLSRYSLEYEKVV